MTTSTRATYPKFKALHPTTNLPLSGGLLYTYTRGTTTPKTTYSDIAKTTPNANPVVLDSAGEATIFLDGSYKFVLKDSAGTTIWTQDDVNVAESTTALNSDYAYGIVTNGSFENDTDGDGEPDGWVVTAQGTVALDATDSNHGAQCLKFTSTGSGGGYIVSEDFMAVSDGTDYTIGFDVVSDVVDVRNLVTVSWYDLDQVIIAGSPVTVWDESAANPTSWTPKLFSVTPASGAAFAKLTLYGCHSSDATSGNTKYDNVRMEAETKSGLTLLSSDNGAGNAPVLNLKRISSSPADNDVLGAVKFIGNTDTLAESSYATIIAHATDVTAATVDGKVVISVAESGSLTPVLTLDAGAQIGSPTGGDQGAGTVNASAYYINGELLPFIQCVEATPITAFSQPTTIMPADDTIPQNTEGDQIITVTITPTSATSRLRIKVSCSNVYIPTTKGAAFALFQDSTADALAAGIFTNPGSSACDVPVYLEHEMAAGTTSATTFKFRLGPSTASTLGINGSTARTFGGVAAVRMSVIEIAG